MMLCKLILRQKTMVAAATNDDQICTEAVLFADVPRC